MNHPPNHHFYRWYVNHSQSWVVYGTVLLKKEEGEVDLFYRWQGQTLWQKRWWKLILTINTNLTWAFSLSFRALKFMISACPACPPFQGQLNPSFSWDILGWIGHQRIDSPEAWNHRLDIGKSSPFTAQQFRWVKYDHLPRYIIHWL
jgi:hypothetical protein